MFFEWSSKTFICFLHLFTGSTKRIYRGPMCCLFLIISETFTEPIGTNLGRNVHWMVLWKVCFCWSKVQRETRGPMVSKRVLSVLILRLWNHWASWYQTWFECSLDGPLESLCFCVDQKCRKETRGTNVSKKVLSVINLRLWNHWVN
jgi:hypothetical protein